MTTELAIFLFGLPPILYCASLWVLWFGGEDLTVGLFMSMFIASIIPILNIIIFICIGTVTLAMNGSTIIIPGRNINKKGK